MRWLLAAISLMTWAWLGLVVACDPEAFPVERTGAPVIVNR